MKFIEEDDTESSIHDLDHAPVPNFAMHASSFYGVGGGQQRRIALPQASPTSNTPVRSKSFTQMLMGRSDNVISGSGSGSNRNLLSGSVSNLTIGAALSYDSAGNRRHSTERNLLRSATSNSDDHEMTSRIRRNSDDSPRRANRSHSEDSILTFTNKSSSTSSLPLFDLFTSPRRTLKDSSKHHEKAGGTANGATLITKQQQWRMGLDRDTGDSTHISVANSVDSSGTVQVSNKTSPNKRQHKPHHFDSSASSNIDIELQEQKEETIQARQRKFQLAALNEQHEATLSKTTRLNSAVPDNNNRKQANGIARFFSNSRQMTDDLNSDPIVGGHGVVSGSIALAIGRKQQSLPPSSMLSTSHHSKSSNSNKQSLLGPNSLLNMPEIELVECDEEDDEEVERSSPRFPSTGNMKRFSRSKIASIDIVDPFSGEGDHSTSANNLRRQSAASTQSDNTFASQTRGSESYGESPTQHSTMNAGADENKNVTESSYSSSSLNINDVDNNASITLNDSDNNEDKSMNDTGLGEDFTMSEYSTNSADYNLYGNRSNSNKNNNLNSWSKLNSSLTEFEPSHSAITEEDLDDIEEEDETIEFTSSGQRTKMDKIQHVMPKPIGRQTRGSIPRVGSMTTKNRNPSKRSSFIDDSFEDENSDFDDDENDDKDVDDGDDDDDEDDDDDNDKNGDVENGKNKVNESAHHRMSDFRRSIFSASNKQLTGTSNGTDAQLRSKSTVLIFGYEMPALCYSWTWLKVSVFIVHKLPCFWCVEYPYTDKTILGRLNALSGFFAVVQLASSLYLTIILFAPDIVDRHLPDTETSDEFFGFSNLFLTFTWNSNGSVFLLGICAAAINIANVANIRVIRYVNLIGAVRYLWFLLWVLPFEFFLMINLIDFSINAQHVWVKFAWRDPTMAKFREYFCEPVEYANTLCTVPVMATSEEEEQWCLDQYNQTTCSAIRDSAKVRTDNFLQNFYFCNGLWSFCVLFLLFLAIKRLENIISHPITQKSKESNMPSWLMLPTISCIAVGSLFAFPEESVFSVNYVSASQFFWIGPMYIIAGVMFFVGACLSWFMSSYTILSTRDKRTKSAAILLFITIMGSLVVLLFLIFTFSVVLAYWIADHPISEQNRATMACYLGGEGSCTRCDELFDQCPEWTVEDVTRILQAQAKSSATLAIIGFMYTIIALRFGFNLRKHLSMYQIAYV